MPDQIEKILTRNVEEVIPAKGLAPKLKDEKLRVYYGVDPSGPRIHLGHAVCLWKLKELQDLGHQIILLIGDFTGRIGDPTDRSATRVALTHDEVLENAKTYQEQVGKIIDLKSKDNPVEVRFNSEWLDKLTFKDIIELSAHFTVQRMLERDMYQERLKEGKPIHLHEFLYPLMQGYDSIALKADIEVGGTDQTFNMLAGRALRRDIDQVDKYVITIPLLLGTDGRKMSKSYNNDVGIADPPEKQYGQLMSMKDELIIDYFKLCTPLTLDKIDLIKTELKKGANPRDVKARLARQIVALYHGPKAADRAAEEFDRVFKEKQNPSDIPIFTPTKYVTSLVDLLVAAKLASSKGEARRLISQNAVKINKKIHHEWKKPITLKPKDIIQVGKRKFIQIA